MACRPPLPQRLYFLDWLRVGAFGLLVLYHVGMYYVSWPFHVKSPHPVVGLEPWMRLVEPWRMSLIFLVSGAATAHLLRGRSLGRGLRRRTRFLLLPLLTGVVLVVPPQTYFEVVQKFGYHDGFVAFLGRYFAVLSNGRNFCDGAVSNSHCLVMPTWNHLWFLAYLWCYTAVLFAVVAWWPRLARAVADALVRGLRGAGLFVLPAAWLVACRVVLHPLYPPTHALWGDGYAHALYGFAFGTGLLLMQRQMEGVWSRLAAARHVALVVALSAWVGLVFLSLPRWLNPWLIGVFQWSAICALLGLAVTHLDRDAPHRAMLTEAVFPVYLVHQTVMILLSQALLGWPLPAGVEAVILVGATGGISFGFYRLVRRWAVLRPWVGLRTTLRQPPPLP
jgi:glucans biosynthesis protein C